VPYGTPWSICTPGWESLIPEIKTGTQAQELDGKHYSPHFEIWIMQWPS